MTIGIFGYDFSHYKTTEIVKNTFMNGHKIGAVFLAPKINYSNNGDVLNIDNSELNKEIRVFCKNKSIQVFQTNHSNDELIGALVLQNNIDIGLIGGARLIPEKVINLFEKGIINYHPGKVPETSGLDSFYRSIQSKIPLFVTAHLIDKRVDAGLFILESRVKIFLDDTPEAIKKRIILKQVKLNHQVLNGIKEKSFNLESIVRPKKNEKLRLEEKEKIMKGFENWKHHVYDY